jgi:predicted methyltransferase
VQVALTPSGVEFDTGLSLGWDLVDEIAETDGACFVVSNGVVERRIQAFSSELDRSYSLLATPGAPTVMISGILMHRVKGITPDQDTARKLATLRPIGGRVLDTASGLGYTAIEAVRRGAQSVLTIELDPTMHAIARDNPWSNDLFSDARIERVYGDAFDVIRDLADRSFVRVIHDPPVMSLAGQLYSAEFYAQLLRVLQRGGRLFHYIGDLNRPSGRTVAQGAVRRLQEVGFRQVIRRPEAFGLLATV